MFVRKKQNKSGSVSIQIISKTRRKYKVVKTIGSGRTKEEIEVLYYQAKQKLSELEGQQSLFVSEEDVRIEAFINNLNNAQVRVIGHEFVLGKIYDLIGFSAIKEILFRHLVITRLVYPGSKLKTIDYLQRYQGVYIKKNKIYRFLDKLSNSLKEEVEKISFEHTKKVLGGKIGIVFYDMTTLYFEASEEDDLRRTGFSKDGKHQNPQIFLGLLVSSGGFPIGYDIFEGNIYEGHTLLPIVKKFEQKYNLSRPVVIADSGLLSKQNIENLVNEGYKFILGARIKNETKEIKKKFCQKIGKQNQFLPSKEKTQHV